MLACVKMSELPRDGMPPNLLFHGVRWAEEERASGVNRVRLGRPRRPKAPLFDGVDDQSEPPLSSHRHRDPAEASARSGTRPLENIGIRTLNGLSNGMLTGSWKTTYGEVRLVQVGDLFVGDYADNGVIIGGRAEDGTITGQFGNGSRVGQFSWEAKAGRVDGEYEITFDGSWSFIDEEGASSWSGEKVDHGKPTLMTITGLPVEVMNDPVTEGPVEEAPAPFAGPAPAETVDDEAPADAIRVARQNDLPATGEIAEDEARSDHFAGPAPDVLSRWSAGDRVLGLQTAGGFRQYIVLEAPNPEHVGRVLFRGWAAPDGPFVHGYARVFRDGCEPLDYPVSGLDLAETGNVVFLGFKPFLGRDCAQSGYIQQVLTWTRLD